LFSANGSSDDLSIVNVKSGKVERKVKIGGLPWGVVTGGK
jgi:YVTN family beta-propeller protein